MNTVRTVFMCLCILPPSVEASSGSATPSATESGPIAMIGSGLIFVSLVASSTRKRKGSGDCPDSERPEE